MCNGADSNLLFIDFELRVFLKFSFGSRCLNFVEFDVFFYLFDLILINLLVRKKLLNEVSLAFIHTTAWYYVTEHLHFFLIDDLGGPGFFKYVHERVLAVSLETIRFANEASILVIFGFPGVGKLGDLIHRALKVHGIKVFSL